MRDFESNLKQYLINTSSLFEWSLSKLLTLNFALNVTKIKQRSVVKKTYEFIDCNHARHNM